VTASPGGSPDGQGVPVEAVLERVTKKLGDAMVTISAHEVVREQDQQTILGLMERVKELEAQVEEMAGRLENG
jgi:hypothetical protein